MATIEHVEPGVIRVSGEYDTVYVLSIYHEYEDNTYEVINTNEHVYGTTTTIESAIELASEFADMADDETNQEIGDGMTDVEADTLASAGYGYDYAAFGDAY